jgi:hypothetical protein
MKQFFKSTFYTLLLLAMVCVSFSCSYDDLDIRQDYLFDLVTMPVQKKIMQGETTEIRCQIVREGEYSGAKYYIRFFQPDGEGVLKLDDGMVFKPNDLYPLSKMTFRLYYTSECSDQQTIDVYIEDNFGRVVQKTFSFQNESVKDNKEPEISIIR